MMGNATCLQSIRQTHRRQYHKTDLEYRLECSFVDDDDDDDVDDDDDELDLGLDFERDRTISK